MTPEDSARLALAKRAYQAAQPSALEVQAGVRRARISLRRAGPRRKWPFKGLVLVVLALGSLAYAKPHALGELAERALPLLGVSAVKSRATLASPAEASRVEPAPTTPAVAPAAVAPLAAVPAAQVSETSGPPTKPLVRAIPARLAAKLAPAPAPLDAPSASLSPAAAPSSEPVVSDWGRVGQALARGDEAGALSALGKLSQSDDARTRDKADLGRAQLLLAHGEQEQACALARSLTRRRAGGHIERQALMLLKDCAR